MLSLGFQLIRGELGSAFCLLRMWYSTVRACRSASNDLPNTFARERVPSLRFDSGCRENRDVEKHKYDRHVWLGRRYRDRARCFVLTFQTMTGTYFDREKKYGVDKAHHK